MDECWNVSDSRQHWSVNDNAHRKGYIRDYPRKYHGVALVECCLKKETTMKSKKHKWQRSLALRCARGPTSTRLFVIAVCMVYVPAGMFLAAGRLLQGAWEGLYDTWRYYIKPDFIDIAQLISKTFKDGKLQ